MKRVKVYLAYIAQYKTQTHTHTYVCIALYMVILIIINNNNNRKRNRNEKQIALVCNSNYVEQSPNLSIKLLYVNFCHIHNVEHVLCNPLLMCDAFGLSHVERFSIKLKRIQGFLLEFVF